jgi:hypothetical protein
VVLYNKFTTSIEKLSAVSLFSNEIKLSNLERTYKANVVEVSVKNMLLKNKRLVGCASVMDFSWEQEKSGLKFTANFSKQVSIHELYDGFELNMLGYLDTVAASEHVSNALSTDFSHP